VISIGDMWWVAGWAIVTAIGLLGTIASLNSVRFSRRVADDARALIASSANPPPPITPSQLAALPPPVRRYLTKAIPNPARAIRHARLRHGGSFRASLNGSWLKIRGEQYFTANPPGFVWWGRVRMAPGLWIDARDRSVNAIGNMLVRMASTVTLADSSGPQLDQGALLRLLGEMAWFPTAFLDDRYVTWSPVDNERARASLDINGRTVSAEFAFGPDDLPESFSADRYRDTGGRTSVLTPFVGRTSDFRQVEGVLVPYRVAGAWIVDGETMNYADFEVKSLEFTWR
jgi:hypothetical protein